MKRWLLRGVVPGAVSVALVGAVIVSAGGILGLPNPALIAGTDFTISTRITAAPACTATALLAPGVNRCFTYSVHNDKSVAITVTSLTLAPDATKPVPPACPLSNLDLAHASFSGTLNVPAGGTATTSGLTIALKDTGADQAGCKSTPADPVTFFFVYSGTASFTQVIATSTALASSPNPSTTAQAVTFTATVTPGSTPPGPWSGNVTFKDGSTTLGTVAVDATGRATLARTLGTVGSHTVAASYADTQGNFTSSSGSLLQQVTGTKVTAVALNSAQGSTGYGDPVTFLAQVDNPSGAGKPTGAVTFSDGATVLGTGTVGSNARATFTTSVLGVGSHTITAAYSGDAVYAVAMSNAMTQVVTKATRSATLVSSLNPSPPGQPVTFTATVAPSASPVFNPTGTVTFKDGSTVLATVTLNGGSQATLTTGSLDIGGHPLTAAYSGDANFTSAISNTVTQTVSKAKK